MRFTGGVAKDAYKALHRLGSGTFTKVETRHADTFELKPDETGKCSLRNRVKAGGTITWTNEDSFAHTVTKGSGPGAKFDSGTVDGGGTFKHKFDTAGKIDYVCTIHPNQTGTITVE